MSNALTLLDVWCWRREDVLLHTLPVFHIHGLFVALHCALLGGSRVIYMPRFDLSSLLDFLPRASVLMGVPTFYTRLLESEALDHQRCAGMRLFISGSAPLLSTTQREFRARTGHSILERYGMTEAGMITSNPYFGERCAGSVGYPLPGVGARVVDGEGREVPRGEPGELEITGPSVFRGYWRMAEKTAQVLHRDGWFSTGDLVRMADDGRVTIVGRNKDLVISGGLNVYPGEVEAVIDSMAGVLESAVIGVPHADLGEAVVAIVVAEGSGTIDAALIMQGMKRCIARFKQPKRVLMVDALPRNVMGKVQKSELRESYRDLFS